MVVNNTRLHVSGTYNFRPVVGVRGLYRSDALTKLNREGRSTLRELGVKRVIDMRSDFDRRLGGRDRLHGVGTELIKIPIATGGTMSQIDHISLKGIYRELLDERGGELARVIMAVADAPPGAVVIHCTAGKDRSGLAAALIQAALGIPMDTIIVDYTVSEGNLAGEWERHTLHRMRRFHIEVTAQLREVLLSSPKHAIREALNHLCLTHGSVKGYLASIGIDESVIERLRLRISPTATTSEEESDK